MPARLQVRWVHADAGAAGHPWVRAAKVSLAHEGVPLPEAAGSAPGRRAFDLPAGAGGAPAAGELRLQMTISAPGAARPLFELDQRLRVGYPSQGAGAPVVEPTGGRFGRELDPRVRGSLTGLGAGTKAQGGALDLVVDTRFLEATALLRDLGVSADYDAEPEHHSVIMKVLLYTGPGGPLIWKVFVPFGLFADPFRREIPALVFFRPTGDPYGSHADARSAFGRAMRYFLPPSARDPFFALGSGPRAGWSMYPRCGWERQLSQSERPVLLVAPLPNASDYGALRTTTDLRGFVGSIVATLWADGLLGEKRVEGLRAGRLGIAGYSFGGGQMLAALANNADEVDEAYMFDPNGFPGAVGAIKTWFQKKPGRRLRMFAGFTHNHGPMLSLQKALASPQATVVPDTVAFWHEDPLYRAACTHPARPELLTRSDEQAPPGSASAESSVFVVPPGLATQPGAAPPGLTLEGRFQGPKGPQTQRRTLTCANPEAAGVLRYEQLPAGLTLPIASAAQFARAMALIETADLGGKAVARIPEMRHSWAVIGGHDTAGKLDRGATFVGHLEAALRASAFGDAP